MRALHQNPSNWSEEIQVQEVKSVVRLCNYGPKRAASKAGQVDPMSSFLEAVNICLVALFVRWQPTEHLAAT